MPAAVSSATALPPGHYRVDLIRTATVGSNEVDSSWARVWSRRSPGKHSVQTVQVTGPPQPHRRHQRPLTARPSPPANWPNCQSRRTSKPIIQLAPNTTQGDPRFGGASLRSAARRRKTAYYINGFPVTNPLTQLGASNCHSAPSLQANVLTGGFGAEFGRSIGGVVNIVTQERYQHLGSRRHGLGRAEQLARQAPRHLLRQHRRTGKDRTDGRLTSAAPNTTIERRVRRLRRRPDHPGQAVHVRCRPSRPRTDNWSAAFQRGYPDHALKAAITANRTLRKPLARQARLEHHRQPPPRIHQPGDDFRGRYQKYGYVLDNPTSPRITWST